MTRALDLIEKDGRRVLVVGVRNPAGTFRITPNLGEREDFFTPVDGFVPSIGFGAAVFDRRRFNHAYISGHLSYKTAPDRAGYALGFERPLFRGPKLYVGAEVRDLTSTDDTWQISGVEASLAGMGPGGSYRDYYRRRGAQVHAAARIRSDLEVLFAWRGERYESLDVRSDFSIWNDEPFRPNRSAVPGKLNALIAGLSFDSLGFETEPLAATYRRHQLDTFFGSRPGDPPKRLDGPVWRLDWTSEIAGGAALGGDFDFQRHVVAARLRIPLTMGEELAVRGIAGWSGGELPLQRQFALGGIGSVHGYAFKEAVGDRMTLLNVEYAVGRLRGVHVVPFFDLGRVQARGSGSRWLKGTGFGLGFDEIRLDFGYRLSDIPGSLQLQLRIDRTF